MTAYETITNIIIKKLENGTIPWNNPIKSGLPKNLISNKKYRGINTFLLAIEAMEKGYSSNYWATFKQIKKAGGSVKKGEKATIVHFWKLLEKDEIDPKTGEVLKEWKMPVPKIYFVFNLDQCEDITALDNIRDFEPLQECERIINEMPEKPDCTFGLNKAFYSPVADLVNIPKAERFKSAEEYYSTFFHELAHSTGHSKRLNREGITKSVNFGSEDYSMEELIAEMGAAFLCGHTGISPATINNSAAYIKGWLRALKDDSRMVVYAASSAQKATDYILNK